MPSGSVNSVENSSPLELSIRVCGSVSRSWSQTNFHFELSTRFWLTTERHLLAKTGEPVGTASSTIARPLAVVVSPSQPEGRGFSVSHRIRERLVNALRSAPLALL